MKGTYTDISPLMKNFFRKLHNSEVLLLAAYAGMFASSFFMEKSASEDINFFIFIAIMLLSLWTVWRHKVISPVLYPFYLYLGAIFGLLLSNSGGVLGLFLGLIFLGLICLEIIWGALFAAKDSPKMIVLIMLSFLVVFTLDRLFITSDEMGEKGPTFYLDEYPDWRILQ